MRRRIIAIIVAIDSKQCEECEDVHKRNKMFCAECSNTELIELKGEI